MVQSCSAYGCKNRYHKDKNISFHKFPLARPDICGKWVSAIKRGNFKPTKYSNICSQHFTKDCFKRECNNRVLKENAVPSLFSFSTLQVKDESLEEVFAPETDFTLSLPGAHTQEPDVLRPGPDPSSSSSPVTTYVPAPPPSAPLREENQDQKARLGAFVSCDHNYTAEDTAQQKRRVEQLEEQLHKLRRKLKTLRQKCRRQERQLERFRAMEELSQSEEKRLELSESYLILPSELLNAFKGMQADDGV